jgi:DNA polymerase I-like protein with 3'-5' exonuclease and polymerase domains
MDDLFPQEQSVETEVPAKKTRRPRAPQAEKPKKAKPARDIRSVFREKLAGITVDGIKKPWMAEKVFRLVTTADELEAWADGVLTDASRHHASFNEKTRDWTGAPCPVIAVDTETTSLDTRIFTDIKQGESGDWYLVYEVRTEIAGVCLSADGIEGLYVPINHEKGVNVPRADVARILQRLFDRCHLIFYNGKFDREVMKITLGMSFRGYPYFEDVQVLNYINDPKADFGDKASFQGGAEGLKKLSERKLEGIKQIEIDEVAKVRCHVWNPETGKNTLKQRVVPFTWIPPDIALWYAAADAICTWLLWDGMKELARSRRLVHRIDHELVDSLAYVERQRFLVDVDRQHRTARWHGRSLAELKDKLTKLAAVAGWTQEFNPGSTKQLSELLFKMMGFKPYRTTDGGAASTDKETLTELAKDHPDNGFIVALKDFRELAALHPDNLRYDPKDNSARIYLKQNVVAGGRLSGGGGEFEKDGGLEWNPQGVKKLEKDDFWRVYGNVLEPDSVPEHEIEEHDESELSESCFVEDKGVKTKAPGIIKNHIGLYQDYAICLVPGCKTCKDRFGILIEDTSLDANQVVNLRVLMTAPPGWTFFSIDYSNIEMRAMANLSGEPKYVQEFLTGSGDFHDLTAKNIFPQYSDPTSKDYKSKTLRSIAKIINFAINYGGTAHAVYKNLIKKDPTMTMKRAEELVDKYWAGVPEFKKWCEIKQARARDEFVTETSTGRVINFKSAMEHEHIRFPTKQEKALLKKYYDYKREAKAALERKDEDVATSYKNAADRLWKNPDTGVRNAIDYNQFMSKAQRVAVNTPVQGLCGDFMRISINRIKKWVEKDPDVQKVFRFHGSVHDEIDVSIKNEYVPFILPRLTRWMKLRKYHESMSWPVPIECDAEYGRSWDVDWSINKVGYTYIDGLETYVPDIFDSTTVNNLYRFIASGDETKREKARGYLQRSLHPRAFESTGRLFKAQDRKEIQQQLVAVLQLHEYWTIDTVPDGDDNDRTLETLAQYEERMGISARDPRCPEFGYMGAIPLDNPNVIRPEPNLLGDPPITTPETSEPQTEETAWVEVSSDDPKAFLTHKVEA